MNSISGANQPVAIGTGKFIKHFRLPVYFSVIKGGYLTSPKYNLKDRVGTIEVDFDKLFTPEEIDALSPEQIEDRVNKALYHDDYKWNKEKGYTYDIGDNGAENLENLLYICPKCKKEHVMKSEGNKFYCTNCGNGFTLTNTYDMIALDDTCYLPETQTAWFNMQREIVKEQVKAPDFSFTEKVKLGTLPKYKKLKSSDTSLIVGEGTLTIDRSGLTYNGTKDGEKFSFHLDSQEVPTYGMCTDVSRFYTFYKGEFMEFYPENNVVEKFFLVTEEIHRLNGGKWQDFKFEK
jgi:ribosomal protein L37AE/L43A